MEATRVPHYSRSTLLRGRVVSSHRVVRVILARHLTLATGRLILDGSTRGYSGTEMDGRRIGSIGSLTLFRTVELGRLSEPVFFINAALFVRSQHNGDLFRSSRAFIYLFFFSLIRFFLSLVDFRRWIKMEGIFVRCVLVLEEWRKLYWLEILTDAFIKACPIESLNNNRKW